MDDVLIINSYAGSLTIAARSLGLDVRGSYEDSAFGIHIQKKNFPKLRYVDHLPWPRQDLRRTLVIAHPPCSAFSVQTWANAKIHGHDPEKISGVNADAFQCTERVLKYAMEQNAAAVLVESVMGALEGARSIHDGYAAAYGYGLFRILQNAAAFGVPQWRERFWAVFVRDDARFRLNYAPEFVVLRDALDPNDRETRETFLERQRAILKHEMMLRDDQIQRALTGPPYGKLNAVLKVRDPMEIRRVFGSYSTSIIRVLDPDWFAPTIMPASRWVYDGSLVSKNNYKRIMGFPPEYDVPGADFKKYLTKGVCPPVAAWLLKNFMNGGGDHVVEDGEILDLRVDKKNVGKNVRHGKRQDHQMPDDDEDFLGEASNDDEDFLGTPKIMPAPLRSAFEKRSSGQRFRELIIGGAANQEALDAVRREFPDSRATLADAAWNRRELRINKECYDERGFLVKPRSKTKRVKETFDDIL